MNAKKSQSRGRGPLISITVQRRPRRRGGVLRGLVGLVLAITKPEPIAKYGGGSGARSSSSKASQGRGAPIRSASWQGPDPRQGDALRGRGYPFGGPSAGDDGWLAEMEARHGVNRWGQPIEGHPRWSTPEGQAELDAAMAAEFGPDGEGSQDGDGMQDGGADPSGVEAGAV